MELRCTYGTVASIPVSPEMRGRWFSCACPGCGCYIGGQAEETPRPVETTDCPDCGKRHYSFGRCPVVESDEVYEPRSYLDWEHALNPKKRSASRTTTRFVRCGSQ